MDWSYKVEEMDWWTNRLRPFSEYCAGSLVPRGYEAIGRLFHPINLDDGQHETWTELAERNSRIAHGDMQLHAIATPHGSTVQYERGAEPSCWCGDLPEPETLLLRDVVARFTSTPDTCWFGVWEGYGGLHRGGSALNMRRTPAWLPHRFRPSRPGRLPPSIAARGPGGPRNRPHYLMHGALSEIESGRDLAGQTPNLWWPDDRAWFVATDIDFRWTLVGGSTELIAELERTAGLEVMATSYGADHTVNGDTINT